MVKRMHHTGFVVSDLDLAIEFYEKAVGLEVQSRYERQGGAIDQVVGYDNAHLRIAHLGTGDGHMLELIQYMNPPPEQRPTSERSVIGGTHLAFAVDDIHATFEALSNAGGQTMNPPAQVGPGRTACYLRDPDGNWVELMEIRE